MKMAARGGIGGLALLAACIAGTPASAGIYTDDLSKCLVASASEADQTLLIQWMFSAFSAGPAVQALSKVTPEQRAEFNRSAAGLFERLMTVSCRAQAVAAIKYEGSGAIEAGFSTLGNVAARGMLADPAVTAEMSKMASFMSTAKLEELGKEAGAAIKK